MSKSRRHRHKDLERLQEEAIEQVRPPARADDILRCSFCGKSQHEVSKLIAGPSVYICNECVDICNEILAPDPRRLQEVVAYFYSTLARRAILRLLVP
jgi:hypothetical protein